ncbi:MAG TPA: hypothetical protein VL985_15210, partial [Stellaceae bacterium]|nr:hypothetical protein [Stellaceae bacterium]
MKFDCNRSVGRQNDPSLICGNGTAKPRLASVDNPNGYGLVMFGGEDLGGVGYGRQSASCGFRLNGYLGFCRISSIMESTAKFS